MDPSAYETHTLWNQVTATEEQLAQTEGWADQGFYPLAAARWLANTLRSHQEPTDTMPYSTQVVDGLNSNMVQICGALVNANSARDLSHLQATATYIDSALQQVAMLPPVANREPAKQASRTFVEYRDSLAESVTRLNERAKGIEDLLARHAAASEEGMAEAETRVATLKTLIDQLEAKITQDQTRLDTALTTNNDAFTKAQTDRQERFIEFLVEKGEHLDSLAISEISDIEATKISAEEHLHAIEKLHEDVEKVSGKAATAILAKDYGSYSTREWLSGIVAYILGFVALVALGVYLIHTVSNVSKDEHVSWQYVALKLGLTATAIAAATVAFQFGGHALSRANTNKRVQLELGTIGTFLADVDDEEAVQAAKVDFVNRMFGRAWDEKPAAVSEQTVNVSAFGKMVDLFLKAQGKS